MAIEANTIKELIEMVTFANRKGDTIAYGLETSEFGLKVEEIANACGLSSNLYRLG